MEHNIVEIPFSVKDSELMEFEYHIPDGYEGIIENGVFKLKKTESKDEKIRKELIKLLDDLWSEKRALMNSREEYEMYIAWLEKQGEQKPAEWSEEDKLKLEQAIYVLHQQGYTDVEKWLKSLRPQK